MNKIDKLLTRLIKKKREKTQTNKIRNKRGEITTDTKEIQEIVRKYIEELHAKNWKIWMDKFLERDIQDGGGVNESHTNLFPGPIWNYN